MEFWYVAALIPNQKDNLFHIDFATVANLSNPTNSESSSSSNLKPLPAPIWASIKTKSFIQRLFGEGQIVELWKNTSQWQAVQLRVSLLHHLFSKGLDSLKTSTCLWRHRFWGEQNIVVISFGCFFFGGGWFALHLWYFDFMILEVRISISNVLSQHPRPPYACLHSSYPVEDWISRSH